MATEHHAAIGKMIEEYRDNCLSITCLKEQLHTLGKNLVEWGETLQTSPANVTIRNNQIVVRRRPCDRRPDRNLTGLYREDS